MTPLRTHSKCNLPLFVSRDLFLQTSLSPSFALFLPKGHLFPKTQAKIFQASRMLINRILGKTGSRNTRLPK